MASGEHKTKRPLLEHDGSSGDNHQVPGLVKSSETSPTSSGKTNAFHNPKNERPQNTKGKVGQ